jgi:hypothetical protein
MFDDINKFRREVTDRRPIQLNSLKALELMLVFSGAVHALGCGGNGQNNPQIPEVIVEKLNTDPKLEPDTTAMQWHCFHNKHMPRLDTGCATTRPGCEKMAEDREKMARENEIPFEATSCEIPSMPPWCFGTRLDDFRIDSETEKLHWICRETETSCTKVWRHIEDEVTSNCIQAPSWNKDHPPLIAVLPDLDHKKDWHCFENEAKKGQSSCASSKAACEKRILIKKELSEAKHVPFKASSCELPVQMPWCYTWDGDPQVTSYYCTKTQEECTKSAQADIAKQPIACQQLKPVQFSRIMK